MDSTILADAVATQDTVTQLVSAIRRVAREVPDAAEQIAKVCTGTTTPGRARHTRKSGEARCDGYPWRLSRRPGSSLMRS